MKSYRLLFVAGLSFIALCLISMPLVSQPFGGGNGTANDPYIISESGHLQEINETDVNGFFIYYNNHFLQTADLDMDAIVSQPIGNGIYPFTGSYDGNDYIISNLSINNPNNDYTGLFGYISLATIKNVGLQNANFSGQYFVGSLVGYSYLSFIENCRSSGGSVNATGQYTGGLVGYNYQGNISKSHTDANLSVLGDNYVGGLVGYNDGGSLSDSYSRGLVSGDDWVAGLVAKQVNGTIEGCYATGFVDGLRFTGGLVGYDGPTRNTVTDSYWDVDTTEQLYSDGGEGKTTGDMTYPYHQDTYVGWNFNQIWSDDYSGTINNGYPFLSPPFNWETTDFAGGDGSEINPYEISNAYQMNRVRDNLGSNFIVTEDFNLNVPPWKTGEGWVPIGTDENNSFSGKLDGNNLTISNLMINRPNAANQGLFGYIRGNNQNANAKVSDLYVKSAYIIANNLVGVLAGEASLAAIESVHVSGTLHARAIVGGLVGRLRGAGEEGVKYCSADIVIDYNDVNSWYIGGLVGDGFDGHIEYSYAKGSITAEQSNSVGGLVGFIGTLGGTTGTIKNSYSVVQVDGDERVGGLVGTTFRSVIIYYCYSIGEVLGNDDTGGLIGFTNNPGLAVTNSYWDKWTSGQETSAGGTPKTTHEMLNKQTFENWDFAYGPIHSTGEDYWRNWSTTNLNPYILKTYPYFSWQGGPGEHNYPYPDTTHVKFFSEDRLDHWESFPRLRSDEEEFTYTATLLDTLTICPDTGIEKVYQGFEDYIEYMYPINPPVWDPQHISFMRWKGYILEYLDPEPPHEQRDWYLQVSGERLAPYTAIPLEPNQDNWVGYFLPETQTLWDAFASIRDSLSYIIGQDGGYYYCQVNDVWTQAIDPPNAYYGKMYKLRLRQSVEEGFSFTWDSSRGNNNLEGEDIFHRPKPEYFSFKDGHNFEELFIESIEDDGYLQEIGVFAGDECVGASVFNGEYPVSILAYTNETHRGSEISFVLYKGERREPDRVSMVYARCNRTGEYTLQTLRPGQQIYTLIRIGEGGTRGEVVKPQIVIGQNYPNPFVTRIGEKTRSVRTRSAAAVITRIPLYLPQTMDMSLTVYNIKGQKVREIVSGNFPAGEHRLEWDGTNEYNQTVSSGIYFYRLETAEETITRKMLIVR